MLFFPLKGLDLHINNERKRQILNSIKVVFSKFLHFFLHDSNTSQTYYFTLHLILYPVTRELKPIPATLGREARQTVRRQALHVEQTTIKTQGQCKVESVFGLWEEARIP